MNLSIFSLLVAAGVVFGALADSSSSSRNATPVTGSGLAYAESCQSVLFEWRSSKTHFQTEFGTTSTTTYSSADTYVSYPPETPTVTSLITLCDGHPRVVGQWTTHNATGKTVNYAWTNTVPTFIPASYATPAPCEISPSDCELLYSSWTTHWDSLTRASPNHQGGLLAPPCTTTRIEPTYSTDNGHQCDNCLIAGREIRLLYWPVTTVDGSGDLCSKSAETVSDTATGPPRSMVTEGITITSPTVAVSVGGMSRVDKCGRTIDHTIIPVMPEDVSSVEGARALFTHRQFNFADLNYKCLDDPDLDFVTTGTRTDCYQEVPASAYFTGYANAAGADWWASSAFDNRTIWPNYNPQVIVPETMTSAITSIWGENCWIHPDGIWDPPIALQQEASFPLPKYVPGQPTSYYTPHTDAPQAGPTTPHFAEPTEPIQPTAESQVIDSTPKQTGSAGHGGGEQNGGGSGGWDHSGGQSSGHDDGGSSGQSGNDHGTSNDGAAQDGDHGSEGSHPSEGGQSGQGQDGGGSDGQVAHNGGSEQGGDQSSNDGGQGEGNGDNSDHGSGGAGQGSNEGHHTGHEIIFTTVVTYTHSAGPGTQDDQASTVTRVFTGYLGGDSGGDNTPASATRSGKPSDQGSEAEEASQTYGQQSSAQDSPTSTPAADSGNGGGNDSGAQPSSTEGSGISSAIQSGIGGSSSSDAPVQQQSNVAISITKQVGLRLSALAIVMSIFL